MTNIRLRAYNQNLSIAFRPKLASGDKESVDLSVAFSGHWKGYKKSAVFYTSWDKTVYEILLDDGKCTVPHEVLRYSGYLYIGVRGVKSDTLEIKTSDMVKLRIEKGAPPGDTTTKEPTPDVYQQILAMLADIKEPEKIREIVAEYLTAHPPAPGKDGETPELRISQVSIVGSNGFSSGFHIQGPKIITEKEDGTIVEKTNDAYVWDGRTPVKGEDYWTAADRTALIAELPYEEWVFTLEDGSTVTKKVVVIE